jgi:hypothetical protein
MSDPYNSHGSSLPPVATAPAIPQVAAPRTPPRLPPRDNIARLDVSDSWKRKFRLIEKAGGPDLPDFRALPFGDRFSVNFNFLAVFFGPIYYIVKGLWRQAVVYFIVACVLILILDAMGLGKITRAVGSGLGIVYGLRANISYYKKVVLGEAPWV